MMDLGEQIGERAHSVIHHLAAHRFTLISVFVVPLLISVSRLSHALAAPFFVFLLQWRRCGTCGNAVGLGCVVLAYGRECLVLRRSSSVLVCRGRVGFVWWRTVRRRRHFSLVGRVGVVQGPRDLLSLTSGGIGGLRVIGRSSVDRSEVRRIRAET